jgi:hypothetical protein
MKRLLVIAFLLVSTCDVHAKEQHVRCPGDTTVDIRRCDSFLLDQSDLKLKRLAGKDFKAWQETRNRLCDKAFSDREGTIWPQLLLQCNTSLNEALIKQFEFKLGD